MKILFLLVAFSATTISITSCNKAQHEFEKNSFNEFIKISNVLPFAKISQPIKKLSQPSGLGLRNGGTDGRYTGFEEDLEPLIINGSEIRDELISIVTNVEGWSDDPDGEVAFLLSLDDVQLAEISLALSVANESMLSGSPDPWECVISALGLVEVRNVISGASYMNARTALQIIKSIGRKYLGVFGLIGAIYTFTTCMMSED